jgi:hypothetical protein
MWLTKHALTELHASSHSGEICILGYSDARSRTNQISGLKPTELQPNGHFRICGGTPKRLDKASSSVISHEKHDVEVRDTAIAADQSNYRVPKAIRSKPDESDDSNDNSWISASSSMNLFDRIDFICFRCRWHRVVGQFAVFADGIRIIRSFPKKEMWRRSFGEPVEIRKITSPKLANIEGKTPRVEICRR